MERGAIAKISRPVVREVYLRERLFARLDCLQDLPATWITGPGGSGKTTLVTSYLDTRQRPCLWYQIDLRDSDVATFFYYMNLAAKKASPRFRKPLSSLTPEYLQGISIFTLRYFETLFSRLKVPFTVVLDNYHAVSSESNFHQVINDALSVIPNGIRVIIISRHEIPAVLSQHLVNGGMGSVDWSDLRFTLEESGQMIELRTQQIKSKKMVERLHTMADGWVAGLLLILDALNRGIQLRSFEKSSPKVFFNYFRNEIFERLETPLQTFLLKTAILPRMTVPMVQELTGIADGESLFALLRKENIFIEHDSSAEPWYQYHALFRNFLISHARAFFPPKVFLDLQSRAALLLTTSGQIEEAGQIYADSENWEGLIRLITEHAPPLLSHGRYQPLEKWLTALPHNLVENDPWLLFFLGSCRSLFNPSSSLNLFETAFNKFRKQEDMAGVLLSWASIVRNIHISSHHLSRLDYWIDLLEELIPDIQALPPGEIGVHVVHSMVAALSFRQPQHPVFRQWADKGLLLTEPHQFLNARLWILFFIMVRAHWMGEYDELAVSFSLLSQITKHRDSSPFYKILGEVGNAGYYSAIGAHEKCLNAVTRGLERCRSEGIFSMITIFISCALESSHNVNDLPTAQRFYLQLCQHVESISSSLSDNSFNSRDRHMYHFYSLKFALASGNLAELSHHIGPALKYARDIESPILKAQDHLICSLAMHMLEKNEEALVQLEKGCLVNQEIKSKLFDFSIYLVKAHFAFDRGDEPLGLEFLRKAFCLGKDHGFVYSVADVPSMTTALCIKALEARIEESYVQHYIRKRMLVPETPLYHLENWPWPLQIHTFGLFEVICNGRAIEQSRKAQAKPLQLLQILIAKGEKRIRQEDIADLIWPDADGDAAQHSFEVTLSRLRLLIGIPDAIKVHKGLVALDTRQCWVDAWAFEWLLNDADVLWRKKVFENAVQLTEKAIGFYNGPFMGKDSQEPWSFTTTLRLRNKFMKSLEKLAEHWGRAGNWGKALSAYQKGFEIDDQAEVFCQGLMTCYWKMDQRATAISLYRQFEKKLEMVLGIEPSEKTKSLYNKLSGI